MKEDKQYIYSDGVNINYEFSAGGEKTIVFLHGNGENLGIFKQHSDFFSEKGYRVLRIDSRGHGESDFNENMTISAMADDLYNVFNVLRIPKASVVGFSDGANVAMLFASRHTDRVDKLVLFGGNMNPKGYKLKSFLGMWISYQISKLASRIDKINLPYMALNHLMVKQPDIKASELEKIKNRTLVMAGSVDVVKESHTRYIADCIEKSELCIMEGNHFIPIEEPQKFIDRIYGFIEE